MIFENIPPTYRFVPYGSQCEPKRPLQDISSLSHQEIVDTIREFSQS